MMLDNPIDFYNTRHTFATIMFSRGEDIGCGRLLCLDERI